MWCFSSHPQQRFSQVFYNIRWQLFHPPKGYEWSSKMSRTSSSDCRCRRVLETQTPAAKLLTPASVDTASASEHCSKSVSSSSMIEFKTIEVSGELSVVGEIISVNPSSKWVQLLSQFLMEENTPAGTKLLQVNALPAAIFCIDDEPEKRPGETNTAALSSSNNAKSRSLRLRELLENNAGIPADTDMTAGCDAVK